MDNKPTPHPDPNWPEHSLMVKDTNGIITRGTPAMRNALTLIWQGGEHNDFEKMGENYTWPNDEPYWTEPKICDGLQYVATKTAGVEIPKIGRMMENILIAGTKGVNHRNVNNPNYHSAIQGAAPLFNGGPLGNRYNPKKLHRVRDRTGKYIFVTAGAVQSLKFLCEKGLKLAWLFPKARFPKHIFNSDRESHLRQFAAEELETMIRRALELLASEGINKLLDILEMVRLGQGKIIKDTCSLYCDDSGEDESSNDEDDESSSDDNDESSSDDNGGGGASMDLDRTLPVGPSILKKNKLASSSSSGPSNAGPSRAPPCNPGGKNLALLKETMKRKIGQKKERVNENGTRDGNQDNLSNVAAQLEMNRTRQVRPSVLRMVRQPISAASNCGSSSLAPSSAGQSSSRHHTPSGKNMALLRETPKRKREEEEEEDEEVQILKVIEKGEDEEVQFLQVVNNEEEEEDVQIVQEIKRSK